MALTVEELQIVLSCDATTAQAVLDKMEATVKAYTDKFQKYFNNMGGKKDISVPSLDIVVKDVEKQTKKLAKAGADWKKQYEKTWGESFEDSMKKAFKYDFSSNPNAKWYTPEWLQKKRDSKPNFRYVGPEMSQEGGGIFQKIKDEAAGLGRAIHEDFGPALSRGFSAIGSGISSAVESAKPKVQAFFQELSTIAQVSGSKIGAVLGGAITIGIKGGIGAFKLIGRTLGGIVNGVRGVGSAIKKAFSHTLLGKFVKRLGSVMLRMAAMKLIRGTLDSIKQGLEMLGNAGGTAGKAMNQVKAAGQSVKAALGVALMPVVKALAPVFYQVAQAVTAAGNAIARFLATLLGQSSYTAAAISSSMDDVSSSYGGAGKAAKGALADFDEINLITKSSGGGGGGGAGGDTGFSTVTEELVGSGNSLAQQLHDAFLAGDWEGIGRGLQTGLGNINAAFENWLKGFKELHIGKKFADIINGFFSPDENGEYPVFKDFGTNIGAFLGTLGANIVTMILDVNWGDVAGAFSAFVSGFWNGFKSAWDEELGLRWQRFKLEWAILWNDLKLSALEAWNGILKAMEGNKLAETLFGVSDALEKNQKNIDETKEKASDLDLKYNVLTKTLAENKGKTDDAAKATEGLSYQASYAVNTTRDLQKSLDKLGETNVEPQVNPKVGETIETNDLFSDRPFSHGKNVGEGTGTIFAPITPKINGAVATTDFFSNKGGVITNPTGGITLGIGMRPQVEGPIKSTDLVANSSGVTQDNNGLGISFKVRPEVEGGNTTVTALQSIITGFNEISGKAKKATLSVKMSGAKESAVTKMSTAVSKFFDGSKTSTITINQGGASLTQIQAAANAIQNFPKKVTVDASVNVVNAEALKKALQNALTASAKITVNGQNAGSFKVNANNVNTMASGGIAYGITNAIIGEYAGASSNPEVVAPLSKLQGILESSGTVSKDTMTREQANTMIQLLQRIERKEIEVKPSVGLGQVVQQSLGAYART